VRTHDCVLDGTETDKAAEELSHFRVIVRSAAASIRPNSSINSLNA